MAAQSEKEKLYVRALMVQCREALHEFAQQGDWRTAWPLTHMPDTIENQQLVGSELEMECVLAVLKTKDDLLDKTKASRNRSVRELVSDGEDDKETPDNPEKPGKKGKRT